MLIFKSMRILFAYLFSLSFYMDRNTWVSCEEDGSAGYCWEVDPYTGYTNRVKNVPQGGNYER